ncbi:MULTISPECIES: hypothetical protein [Acinetobacter]|uniref:Uncharacterized protein n=1 Tax=Acinetobacter genomosp. 15BJ TaxID=106651 RepID=A0ABT8UWT0_9GAMM|nr:MULTISPECIES: hypothetical protein [Acinetobacter]MCI3879193.1 hypothetical protein [Acinetobacter higginsii]MDO3657508.1 hypothetical protein [Acinetobacter genomosp. 15BJ]
MMKNKIYLAALLLVFSNLSEAKEFESPLNQKGVVSFNPSTQARVRLYGQNGQQIYMQHTFDCKNRKQGIRENLSGYGAWNAFKTYTRINMNYSIGMPRTIIQKDIEQNFNTYQMVTYKEYVVTANQPINLHGFVVGTEVSTGKARVIDGCENTEASFKPQAGREYEILGENENQKCQFKVYDLASKQLVSVSEQAYSCPKDKWKFWGKDE